MSLEKELVADLTYTAERMGAWLAVVGQRNASKSGSTLGFPDLVLFCNGEVRLIEVKRPKDDENCAGKLNLGQTVFVEKAEEHGVTVHVIDSIDGLVQIVNDCRKAKGVQRR